MPSVFKASGIPQFFYPSQRCSKSPLFSCLTYIDAAFFSPDLLFFIFLFFLPARIAPFLTGTEKERIWVGSVYWFPLFLPTSFSSPFWGDMGLAGSVYWLPFPALSTKPLISGSYRGFWVSILDSWVTILERISVY